LFAYLVKALALCIALNMKAPRPVPILVTRIISGSGSGLKNAGLGQDLCCGLVLFTGLGAYAAKLGRDCGLTYVVKLGTGSGLRLGPKPRAMHARAFELCSKSIRPDPAITVSLTFDHFAS
jgi:hypothetical protein